MSWTEAIIRWPASWALARSAVKRVAVGVHHFDVADDAGTVAVAGQIGGAARVGHRPLLRGGLVGQVADAGQAVLHIAKRHEHLLAISATASAYAACDRL